MTSWPISEKRDFMTLRKKHWDLRQVDGYLPVGTI